MAIPTYPRRNRGWVLNFEHERRWTKVAGSNGANSLVFPSHPDFGKHYNAADPPRRCKRPFGYRHCYVPNSQVPTGLIIHSRGKRSLMLMTSGRALIYRSDLTPTSDTTWTSGPTANGGRNYGHAFFVSHRGRDYAGLIGGCSVRVARKAMKAGQVPDGRLDTSMGGEDAHCGIHHHYEWFAIRGTRIAAHVNRYHSYSVEDGFFHDRPEFPGNPLGPVGGRGTMWTVYNLFEAPKGSRGDGQWQIELLPNPTDPNQVLHKRGWFAWDVVDLNSDGKAEVLATRASNPNSSSPYVLPWETDVLAWNGRDLESVYHRDDVAPTLVSHANLPTRYSSSGSRERTVTRDVSGDGVKEVMVEDRDGHRSFLQIPALVRAPRQ